MSIYSYYQKRTSYIPSFFLLVYLLVVFFGLNSFFSVNKKFKSNIQASNQEEIENLEVINITDKTATVYWKTKKIISAWLIYGIDKNHLNGKAFDDRDLEPTKGEYFHHYVSLKDLLPGQIYYFVIVTPNGVLKRNGEPFFFRTKINPPKLNQQLPVLGRVKSKKDKIIDGIVLIKIEGAETLGSFIKENGDWLVPLYHLSKKNSDNFFIPDNKTPVKIYFFNEINERTEIETNFEFLSRLPQEIVLGKDYIFLEEEEPKVLSKMIEVNKLKKIDVLFPKENASIPGRKPLIKGIAIPGKKVKIFFDKPKQIYEIYSDKDGVWQLTPFYELDPGKNIVKISTIDEIGKEILISRNFFILKSGEGVLGEATPSANLSPTSLPTVISPSPLPSPTLTEVTPTSFIQPTIPVSYFSPTQTPPVSGLDTSILTLSGFLLLFFGLGMILVF